MVTDVSDDEEYLLVMIAITILSVKSVPMAVTSASFSTQSLMNGELTGVRMISVLKLMTCHPHSGTVQFQVDICVN